MKYCPTCKKPVNTREQVFGGNSWDFDGATVIRSYHCEECGIFICSERENGVKKEKRPPNDNDV